MNAVRMVTVDTDAVRALQLADSLEACLSCVDGYISAGEALNLIAELRWMTESRARWKAACENQGGAHAADTAYQMRAFDEEAQR